MHNCILLMCWLNLNVCDERQFYHLLWWEHQWSGFKMAFCPVYSAEGYFLIYMGCCFGIFLSDIVPCRTFQMVSSHGSLRMFYSGGPRNHKAKACCSPSSHQINFIKSVLTLNCPIKSLLVSYFIIFLLNFQLLFFFFHFLLS